MKKILFSKRAAFLFSIFLLAALGHSEEISDIQKDTEAAEVQVFKEEDENLLEGGLQTAEKESEVLVEDDGSFKEPFLIRAFRVIHGLPFGFDLGCEPTINGSLTYFDTRYNWIKNGKYSTKILFNYGSTLNVSDKTVESYILDSDIEGRNVIKKNTKDTALDFRLIPIAFQFDSKVKDSRYFTIEPGLNYRFEKRNVDLAILYEDDDGRMLLETERNEYKHILRPFFSGTVFFSEGGLFSASFEVIYAPVYFYWNNAEMDGSINLYSNKETPYSIKTDPVEYAYNNFGFSEHYVDATLIFSFFNMIATSASFTYERTHKNDISATPIDGDYTNWNTTKEPNLYENFGFKFGGSIINIGKADIRIKTGVFYEWNWEYNHNLNEWTKAGKWIFGVGMKNLY